MGPLRPEPQRRRPAVRGIPDGSASAMDRIFKRPFLWPELYRSPGRVVNFLFCLMQIHCCTGPLAAFRTLADFQQAHRHWVEIALREKLSMQDARWSQTVAVGNLEFVEKMKREKRVAHRELIS